MCTCGTRGRDREGPAPRRDSRVSAEQTRNHVIQPKTRQQHTSLKSNRQSPHCACCPTLLQLFCCLFSCSSMSTIVTLVLPTIWINLCWRIDRGNRPSEYPIWIVLFVVVAGWLRCWTSMSPPPALKLESSPSRIQLAARGLSRQKKKLKWRTFGCPCHRLNWAVSLFLCVLHACCNETE